MALIRQCEWTKKLYNQNQTCCRFETKRTAFYLCMFVREEKVKSSWSCFTFLTANFCTDSSAVWCSSSLLCNWSSSKIIICESESCQQGARKKVGDVEVAWINSSQNFCPTFLSMVDLARGPKCVQLLLKPSSRLKIPLRFLKKI